MGKDFLTPKEISKRIKAKGLQKLRWYCQMCEKQCRDENGFKCHCTTVAHQKQMELFNDNPGAYLSNYSKIFLDDFVGLLSRRFGTKRVLANKVYQEFISHRNHQHMNSTRWQSLTEFVMYLGKEGIAEVDETELGWYVKWIDKSPATLAKQDAVKRQERMKRERAERENMFISNVEKINRTLPDQNQQLPTELVRDNNVSPIKITFQPLPKNVIKSKPTLTKSKFLEKASNAVSKPIESQASSSSKFNNRYPPLTDKNVSNVELIARGSSNIKKRAPFNEYSLPNTKKLRSSS